MNLRGGVSGALARRDWHGLLGHERLRRFETGRLQRGSHLDGASAGSVWAESVIALNTRAAS